MIEIAREWYKKHTRHVDDLMTSRMEALYLRQIDKVGFEPPEEDIKNPELWKGDHWLWFFKEYGME